MKSPINEIAWKCWNERLTSFSAPEEFDADQNDDWEIIDGKVDFGDQETVSKYVAQYIYHEIILTKLDDKAELYSKLRDLWYKQNSGRSLSGIALAFAHNLGSIDLFQLAAEFLDQVRSPYEFSNILEDAVQEINHLDIDSLFEWQIKAHEKSNHDLYSGYLLEALIPFFQAHIEDRDQVIQRYLTSPTENTASLYKLALISIGRINACEAFELSKKHIEQEIHLICVPAIDAIGYFDFQTSEKQQLAESLEYVNKILENPNKTELQRISASTISNLVKKDATLNSYLFNLFTIPKVEVYQTLSHFLFSSFKDQSDHQWYRDLFLRLCGIVTNDARLLSNIDMIMHQYLQKSDPETVEQFLDEWVANQNSQSFEGINLETIFPITSSALLESDRIPLMFTRWMLSNSPNNIACAANLISSLHPRRNMKYIQFEYDLNILKHLDFQSIELLVLRTFGYVFHQEYLLPLTWSLSHVESERATVLSLMKYIFTKHLAYDYPEISIEYLEGKLNQDLPEDVKSICNEVITQTKANQEALQSLPNLRELEPSYRKHMKIDRENDKQMARAVDIGHKQSAFFELVSQIRIKFGTSTFSVDRPHSSEKIRMHSHSISYTLPRSEATDPVGASGMRFRYRSS